MGTPGVLKYTVPFNLLWSDSWLRGNHVIWAKLRARDMQASRFTAKENDFKTLNTFQVSKRLHSVSL